MLNAGPGARVVALPRLGRSTRGLRTVAKSATQEWSLLSVGSSLTPQGSPHPAPSSRKPPHSAALVFWPCSLPHARLRKPRLQGSCLLVLQSWGAWPKGLSRAAAAPATVPWEGSPAQLHTANPHGHFRKLPGSTGLQGQASAEVGEPPEAHLSPGSTTAGPGTLTRSRHSQDHAEHHLHSVPCGSHLLVLSSSPRICSVRRNCCHASGRTHGAKSRNSDCQAGSSQGDGAPLTQVCHFPLTFPRKPGRGLGPLLCRSLQFMGPESLLLLGAPWPLALSSHTGPHGLPADLPSSPFAFNTSPLCIPFSRGTTASREVTLGKRPSAMAPSSSD